MLHISKASFLLTKRKLFAHLVFAGRCVGDRDAGSQSEWGVLRESLFNDVIINAAQHPMFTETR
jgi:hypothetical protein